MIKTLSFDFTGGIEEALQQRQDDRQKRLDRLYIAIGFAAALCITAHLPYVSNACQGNSTNLENFSTTLLGDVV
jgi:hypothetical protein